RIYYLRSRYEDQSAIPNFDTKELTFSYQQLYRDDRFSGGDRIGDTEQVTYGVTTRLIDADTGTENFRASIGQIYYLADRKITLSPAAADLLINDESNIASEISARLSDNWRFQGDLLMDDNASTV